MRKFFAYGPSLLVFVTAMSVLFIAPAVVRQMHTARLEAQVVLARHQLAGGSILEQINAANRAVADSTLPGVVHVDSPRRFRGGSEGSGWIYDDDGHIITNAHVVNGLNETRIEFYDGRVKTARVIGTDPQTDIAVLSVRMDTAEFALPRAYKDDEPHVGDRVFAFGSPFGIKFSMSEGIVSGLARGDAAALMSLREGYTNFIQTDAAINPGNSGGPLVDARGRVVGMNTAIANGQPLDGQERVQGQNAGIGFAIPVQTIIKVADQIIEGESLVRGYLGINLPDPLFNRDEVINQGYEDGAGVFVSGVPEGQPASRSGIRVNDIIIAVDGQRTPTVPVLRSAISLQEPGQDITFTIWRDGAEQDITVRLGAAVNIGGFRGGDLTYIPGSENMTAEEIEREVKALERDRNRRRTQSE
ncbi:MAG: trypsin-like peptidase domain-containing protein [Phycisphaerales bacterium]